MPSQRLVVLSSLFLSVSTSSAFLQPRPTRFSAPLRSTEPNEDDIDRTTFDQAGASLIEEEDRKRMEEMGDFDVNPAVSHVVDVFWLYKIIINSICCFFSGL